eukprot:NODE_242_length_11906_cov_0.577454.p2 type:complete len:262 gc:universal NODE_242_length_11906_cov_0.577454:1089-304(-)
MWAILINIMAYESLDFTQCSQSEDIVTIFAKLNDEYKKELERDELIYRLRNQTCNANENSFDLKQHGIQIIKGIFNFKDVQDLVRNNEEIKIGKCEKIQDILEDKFRMQMCCVDFTSRDSRLGYGNRAPITLFHQDIIGSEFMGTDWNNGQSRQTLFAEEMKQEETFNVWVNLGKPIKNHNLHFIGPGDDDHTAVVEDLRILIPKNDHNYDAIVFEDIETGDAIVFNSNYYFHSSVDYGIEFDRQSIEFRFKERVETNDYK